MTQRIAFLATGIMGAPMDGHRIEAGLFGEIGVVAGLNKGSTAVDTSSISPAATKGFAKRINELGAKNAAREQVANDN